MNQLALDLSDDPGLSDFRRETLATRTPPASRRPKAATPRALFAASVARLIAADCTSGRWSVELHTASGFTWRWVRCARRSFAFAVADACMTIEEPTRSGPTECVVRCGTRIHAQWHRGSHGFVRVV